MGGKERNARKGIKNGIKNTCIKIFAAACPSVFATNTRKRSFNVCVVFSHFVFRLPAKFH